MAASSRFKRLFLRLTKKKRKKARAKNSAARRRAPVLDSGKTAKPVYTPKKPSAAKPRKKRKTHGRIRRILRWYWKRMGRVTLLAGGAAILALLVVWLALPSIDQLNRVIKIPSIVIKSTQGEILGTYGDVYGEYIPYKSLPQPLINAVLATEDRNFEHHFGVDVFGLARAIFTNVRAGHLVQGGSTITQQVAKNLFLSPDRTFMRKLREMLLAFKLEYRFTKQDILTIYVNRVYLGSGTYGVDAAARRYFGKSARDLNTGESALLAGLLKAPSRYAPTSNVKLARGRAEQVLLNMQDAGYLNASQVDAGKAELQVLLAHRAATARSTMYFTDWIIDQLPELVGNVEDDLEITATLDPKLQQTGEQAVARVMDKRAADMDAEQAALLALAPDGAVRAMIGGRSYADSQYNRVTQSRRQPGSAFKLFVYLTALEGGLSPDSTVTDTPIHVGKWQPKNYQPGYKGEMSLRDALAQSINTVAVSLSERFGRRNVIAMAERLGVTSEMRPDPSIALGSNEMSLLELSTAYAHLAAGGLDVAPYGIVEVKTQSGQALYRRPPTSRSAVLSSATVGMMDDMLMHVVNSGTGRAARIGRDVAGKTGTTSDYKDAWFIGFTPDLTTGVWVGNDDATQMKKVTGGTLPAAIWHDFMQASLAGLPAKAIPVAYRGVDNREALPWQNNETPNTNEGVLRKPLPGDSKDGEDFELGTSFWEKLSNSGENNRNYPSGKK